METVRRDELEIEAEMARAGIACYIPFETRLVRVRRQTGVMVPRRFPMLPGYAFVADVSDWPALDACKSVLAILADGDGCPVRIPLSDIEALRKAEADAMEATERQARALAESRKKLTRARASKLWPAGAEVMVDDPVMGKVMGTVDRATGRKTVRVMAQFLGGLVPVEIGIDRLSMVDAA